MGSAGAALQTVKKRHELTQKRTDREEKREIRQSSEAVRGEFHTDLSEHRGKLQQERGDLVFKQRVEVSKTRAEWKSFEAIRSTNWEPLQKRATKEKQRNVGLSTKADEDQETATVDRAVASDFMPKEGAEKATKIVNDRKEKLADRLRQKRQKKEQDKGKGGTER